MAEGLARELGRGGIQCVSAGTSPAAVHPLALRAMAEVDIDISAQKSKGMGAFVDQRFDFVITLCDRAKETCPVWPDAREQIHWSIDDPAAVTGSDAQRMATFRRVRDDIRRRIDLLILSNRIKVGER